jgi:hypothetical protein
MSELNNIDEDRSGKPSPDSGGTSGTQLVVGIVAMLLGSVFLLGGFVLWVGRRPTDWSSSPGRAG